MKVKSAVVMVLLMSAIAGNSFAMMGGGSGTGNGHMGGGTTGTGTTGGGHMGGGTTGTGAIVTSSQCRGTGTGMVGAGGMKTGMFGLTMQGGYLDVLTPIATPQDAIAAFQDFVSAANSSLQISEVWEYQTVYKAELSDTTGHKAFDLVADKVTGAVTPEMGFSMMMNATWGKQLQVTPKFAKKATITPEAAATAIQSFLSKNATVINYTLAAQETYPGYYKFHTTDALGNPGMDIMVNGYNGGIWMNTQIGAPVGLVQ